MLIQFCGPGGTGKSTIKEAFMASDLGAEYITVGSAARVVSKRWGLETEDDQKALSNFDQIDFQREVTIVQFREDIVQALAQSEHVISERSWLDHLAYPTLKFCQRVNTFTDEEKRYARQMLHDIELVALQELPKVDMLVYFPYGLFTPPDDGMRTQEDLERFAIDALMRGFIAKFKAAFALPVLRLDLASKDIRLHHFLQHVLQLEEQLHKEDLGECEAPRKEIQIPAEG